MQFFEALIHEHKSGVARLNTSRKGPPRQITFDVTGLRHPGDLDAQQVNVLFYVRRANYVIHCCSESSPKDKKGVYNEPVG